ncbi:MAG: hypothetical protein U0412_10720 [Nitrospira sp.]
MPVPRSTTLALFLPALALMVTVAHATEKPSGEIELAGDYRYTLQATESLSDAKSHACREAWRQAIVTAPFYREQTAFVVDADLLHSLADSLAARYAQYRQIVEEAERRQTVFCRVRGTVPKDDMTFAIRTHLAGGVPVVPGVEQNRALRILTVREENGTILIQYQALKRLDWLSTHYQGGLREIADIMVDFYDEQGRLLKTDRYPARRTPGGEDIINPGVTAILKIPKPDGVKTFHPWVVK